MRVFWGCKAVREVGWGYPSPNAFEGLWSLWNRDQMQDHPLRFKPEGRNQHQRLSSHWPKFVIQAVQGDLLNLACGDIRGETFQGKQGIATPCVCEVGTVRKGMEANLVRCGGDHVSGWRPVGGLLGAW